MEDQLPTTSDSEAETKAQPLNTHNDTSPSSSGQLEWIPICTPHQKRRRTKQAIPPIELDGRCFFTHAISVDSETSSKHALFVGSALDHLGLIKFGAKVPCKIGILANGKVLIFNATHRPFGRHVFIRRSDLSFAGLIAGTVVTYTLLEVGEYVRDGKIVAEVVHDNSENIIN